jgi:short-subunit dehydrogenase
MVYSASKAYVSNYLQGLRQRAFRLGLGKTICITEIVPGFVDTPLIQGKPGRFWVAPVEKAARQICHALWRRRRLVYITRRWRLMAWFLKLVPPAWHERL